MCGIGGITWTGAAPKVVRDPLAAMEAAMVHRGPNDGGTELVSAAWGTVGMCARRLAIQDVSPRGRQPMSSRRSGSRICLNGEIYNAAELRSELRATGYRFEGHSDTEVVLAAYDEWGPRCFHRLRGMFAIAVWDEPGRRLILARDRLGIKPLYYVERQAELLFASEVVALLASGLVRPSLSVEAVSSYLAVGAVEEPATIISGVQMLPPGHYATWAGDWLRPVAYWSLAGCFDDPVNLTRREAVERIRIALESAVRCHLVSDVSLGVFLSGGIDSSSLVGLVTSVADQPPQTVSVVFPQDRYSEERYIQLLVERFGTKHTQVVLDEAEVLAQVPAAVSAMDQPSFDGVNTFIVSRQAREAGLIVALAGVGGDELFAGYDTFRIVARLQWLHRLLPGPAGLAAATAARVVMHDTDRARKLARWLTARERGLSATALRRELFAPAEVAGLLGGAGPRADGGQPPRVADRVNRVSFFELDRYMRNVLLRDADVMSMTHSLEIRVPFLDHELVELVAGMPGPIKTRGRTPKPLLVEAVADLLPPAVVHRPKMGFTLPFADWLQGILRERVQSGLLDPKFGGPVADLLDHAAVREVWQRFLEGRTEWVRPWSLYALKAWADGHLTAGVAATPRPFR